MLSDGEIWWPLPDEGYRPDILWAGMRWEERKTNHPKRGAMKWRAGKARCVAVTTTCVSCLEDDNECTVYVSYIAAVNIILFTPILRTLIC